MRNSTISTYSDSGGTFEVEIFAAENPKSVIICSHGNGDRRWDGENFFYNVTNQYQRSAFYLVDQNQVIEDGCKLNDLNIMVQRVQRLIERAKKDYPEVPIIILGHSMGCGVAAKLELDDVEKVIFVAPTAGKEFVKLKRRYGDNITKTGGIVKTTDGLNKFISKEYLDSVKSIDWEEEYKKLLNRFSEVYVFESGAEEIVGEERILHKDMPFKVHKIIHGATHNYHGEALSLLYAELDSLL